MGGKCVEEERTYGERHGCCHVYVTAALVVEGKEKQEKSGCWTLCVGRKTPSGLLLWQPRHQHKRVDDISKAFTSSLPLFCKIHLSLHFSIHIPLTWPVSLLDSRALGRRDSSTAYLQAPWANKHTVTDMDSQQTSRTSLVCADFETLRVDPSSLI